nr:MAG TPA: S1-P1 nuclease [Caudoviricetes sp.]
MYPIWRFWVHVVGDMYPKSRKWVHINIYKI